MYKSELGLHELHALIILGDVFHQCFLYTRSFLFLYRPLILHVGRPIQVLILPLPVIMSLMKIVVGELLIAIVPAFHIIKHIYGLNQLTLYCAFSWTMNTLTPMTSVIRRCRIIYLRQILH